MVVGHHSLMTGGGMEGKGVEREGEGEGVRKGGKGEEGKERRRKGKRK